jgi:hypothetical protein
VLEIKQSRHSQHLTAHRNITQHRKSIAQYRDSTITEIIYRYMLIVDDDILVEQEG